MSKVAAIWLTALVVATQATPAYPKVYNLVKEQAPLTRLTTDTLRSAVSGMRIGLDLTKLQAEERAAYGHTCAELGSSMPSPLSAAP
jgi:hypothetical protein